MRTLCLVVRLIVSSFSFFFPPFSNRVICNILIYCVSNCLCFWVWSRYCLVGNTVASLFAVVSALGFFGRMSWGVSFGWFPWFWFLPLSTSSHLLSVDICPLLLSQNYSCTCVPIFETSWVYGCPISHDWLVVLAYSLEIDKLDCQSLLLGSCFCNRY